MQETQIKCGNCASVKIEAEFKTGYELKGSGCRLFGLHPEHRYCPDCGCSIDWSGYRLVKSA